MTAPSLRSASNPLVACLALDQPGQLLSVCRRLTPRIERHSRHLILDLTGCERLLMGPTISSHLQVRDDWSTLAWRLSLLLRAEAPECRPRIGLAATRTLAWLAAVRVASSPCHTPWYVIPADDAAAFLRPLPLITLLLLPDLNNNRAAAEALRVLAPAGITTVGQLRQLSSLSLHRRFGRLGDTLLALASGRDLCPFHPEHTSPHVGVRLRLTPPATAEQVATSLTPLAHGLALHLAKRQQAGCSLELRLVSDADGVFTVRRAMAQPIYTESALMDHAHSLLHALLRSRSPAPDVDTPYTQVHLRIGDLCAAQPQQTHFWRLLSQQERGVRMRCLSAALAPLALRHGTPPLLHARFSSRTRCCLRHATP